MTRGALTRHLPFESYAFPPAEFTAAMSSLLTVVYRTSKVKLEISVIKDRNCREKIEDGGNPHELLGCIEMQLLSYVKGPRCQANLPR